MKNKLPLIVLVLILILLALVFYTNSSRPTSMENTSMTPKETLIMDKTKTDAEEDALMDKSGMYLPFSPKVLTDAANTRRVLFFYANWCPTCKPADSDFEQNKAKLPADVTVIRVNYNDTETDQAEKDLAKQHGITYQHTYVQIDAQGNAVTKWNGGSVEELLSKLK